MSLLDFKNCDLKEKLCVQKQLKGIDVSATTETFVTKGEFDF